MAGTSIRRASDEAAFSTRLERGRARLSVLLPVLLVAGLLVGRGAAAPSVLSSLAGGAQSATPADLLASAADGLVSSTAVGGSGYSFEIVQTSTITAKPGGPKVEIPDPVDPKKILGLADEYYLIGLTQTGYVNPDGFFMEMRARPTTPEAKVDLANGQLLFRALVKAGLTYRDDGRGWYQTDSPPGIGLDPRTVELLPKLLREATQPSEVEPSSAIGRLGTADSVVRALMATASVADIPGVIAADGAPFTELTRPLIFAFDDLGRPTGLIVTAATPTSRPTTSSW